MSPPSTCVVLLAFAAIGCGASEARVTGRVAFDGKPVSHARIVFVKDTNAIHALADESGEYRLLGNDGAGVPIGAYKITVVKMALADGTIPVGRAFELAREQGKLKSVVPKIYADPASTPLKAELRGGDNRVDLELVKTP